MFSLSSKTSCTGKRQSLANVITTTFNASACTYKTVRVENSRSLDHHSSAIKSPVVKNSLSVSKKSNPSFCYWQFVSASKIDRSWSIIFNFYNYLRYGRGRDEWGISSPHSQHFHVFCVLWAFVIICPYSNLCMA